MQPSAADTRGKRSNVNQPFLQNQFCVIGPVNVLRGSQRTSATGPENRARTTAE